ncbi:hypothetical protein LSH36_953g00057 [Paralvinella palmiformis]|uniref:Uncharacterized protein n=1 Tax=Paralvinella palmiformis TaxID=53620 RepID=A0AAD9IY08_9ANNE|nr:hypothetical protein LSH36_953g00057 [Paralvinella palmiformis]
MGILLGLIIGAALLAVVLIFVKKNKSTCLGPASDYMVTSQEGEEHPNGGTYVIQNKRNSVTALMDQYEMSNIADSNYGATWRVHTPTIGQEEGTRLMTPMVTCAASTTETGGSPCRAPDVTCVLRKSPKGPHDPHVYEAPFLGRDIVQLHIGPARDG